MRERDRAEALRHEEAARHRQILESAFDYAIVTTDREGRVTRWNAGENEAEMLGRPSDLNFTRKNRAAGLVEDRRLLPPSR